MSLGRIFLTALALMFLSVQQASAAAGSTPEGLWLTENQRSVIKIVPCEEGFCGHVHWIIEGGMQKDEKNPDESLRGRAMCGLKILWGFATQSAKQWIDGKIYKADEGDLYNATLQPLPSGKLLVHGYIGMPLFGKSQTWTPVNSSDYPACR